MTQELVQGMNKETIVGMTKSKTVRVNTALTVLIIAAANAFGVPLTPVEATAIVSLLFGIANIILRFLTKESLPAKGASKPNPNPVKNLIKVLEENDEDVEKLYTLIAKWKAKKEKKLRYSKLIEKMEKEGVK